MNATRPRWLPIALWWRLLLTANLASSPLDAEIWFTGKEVFPIDGAVNYMQVADFDQDGRVDIALANQLGDEITFLYNQGPDAPTPDRSSNKANQIRSNGRFRIESLPTDLVEIDALIHGDFNSDGLVDLAYSGEPQRLIVLPGAAGPEWGSPFSLPLDGGLTVNGSDALACGDLNGDGRDDIIALTARRYLLYLQTESKTLAPPQAFPVSGTVQALLVSDLNNDRRDDLLLIGGESKQARARFQDRSGTLGPEVFFELLDSGSHWVGDLDGDQNVEWVTVTPTTERARISRLSRIETSTDSGYEAQRQLNFLPVGRVSNTTRGLAWRDIDGDGARDLLVANPANGSLMFSHQDRVFGFSNAVSFPSFADIAQIEVLDWDADGRVEIFVLQKPGNQLGVTRLNSEDRIEFPTTVPTSGLPIAITTMEDPRVPISKTNLEDPRGNALGLALLTQEEGSKASVQLQFLDPEGPRNSARFETDAFKDPSTEVLFRALDADQDGRMDLIAIPDTYEPIMLIFRQKGRAQFELIELEFPGSADRRWLSVGDLDGDGLQEMLTGKDQFLRGFRLVQNRIDGSIPWRLQVIDQVNAPISAEVAGAVFVAEQAERPAGLYVYDRESNRVLLCRKDERGVWRPVQSLRLPDIPFSAFGSQFLGTTEPTFCLTFESDDAIGWMPLNGPKWALEELATYESPIDDNPSLNGVIAGDLNRDGVRELLFLEGAHGHLEVVSWRAGAPMEPITRWKVFDTLFLQQQFTNFAEPREAAIADFTGDGAPDVVTLVHDRIILYPTEPPEPTEDTEGTAL